MSAYKNHVLTSKTSGKFLRHFIEHAPLRGSGVHTPVWGQGEDLLQKMDLGHSKGLKWTPFAVMGHSKRPKLGFKDPLSLSAGQKYSTFIKQPFVIKIRLSVHFWVATVEQFRVFPMRTIPAAGNRKSCLGPVFLTIYMFRSIQFSDTLMSDGYFRIFWTK